ncbi:hypothetical protein AAMO2058_001336000 [Amorphochlora amoebiformis]
MIGICVLLAALCSDAVRTSSVVGGLEVPEAREALQAGSHPDGLELFLNTSRSGIVMAIDQSDAPNIPIMMQGRLREDIASYIITMKGRKHMVSENFRKMGIEYEDSIFEALGPDNVDMDSIRKSQQCKKKCRNMTNGELGCELSHVAILRDFLSKGKLRYCMVFEDDARVNPAVLDFFAKSGDKDLKSTLARLADTHDEWEWHQLNLGACVGTCYYRKYVDVSLPEQVKMADKTFSYCTVAYMVSRKGAELILEEVKNVGLQVADHGIRRAKSFKHVSLEPRLFDQDGGHSKAIHEVNGLKMPQYLGPCMSPDIRKKVGHR